MELLLLYLFLALSVSFLCSVMEAVILSVSASFIHTKQSEGKISAKKLAKHKENIDRPLSAILTLNTIAHTVGAAGVGAQAVAIWGEAYFGLISAVLTILILFLSEILPKTIGALYWRRLALYSSGIITIMIFITYPLVLISELLTKLIAGKKVNHNAVSREDLSALTKLGTKEGVFEENESKIIHNLLRLKSIKVNQILTPRTVVLSAQEDETLLDFFNKKENLKFSRIPVYSKSIDDVTGYVLKSEILENIANDNYKIPLKDLKRDITIAHENFNIPSIFDLLISKKEHIAIILDEYGGLEGIITMEDIIETILGLEIVDEKDSQVDMQHMAKEKWKLRAKKLNIDLYE